MARGIYQNPTAKKLPRRPGRGPPRRRMPAPLQRPNWLPRHAVMECRADHCHAITASSSVLCRAERSTRADGVRKPVSAFAERVLSGPSGNRAPRTMSEASSLIVSAKPMRREHVPLGILYMVGATIVFAVSSAVSKWLVASYRSEENTSELQSQSNLVCRPLLEKKKHTTTRIN